MIRTRRWLAFCGTGLAVVVALGVGSQREAGERFDPPLEAIGAIYPRLSDSGEQIAVSYQGAIWRLARDGGTMTRLTSGEGLDIEPAWSPDGQRIAYIESRDLAHGALRLIRADTGEPIKLPRDVTARDKLYFDRTGKRLFGTFFDANQKPQFAWLDLESGKLSEPLVPYQARTRYALSRDDRWVMQATFRDLPANDEQAGNNGPDVDLWKIPAVGGKAEQVGHFHARVYDMCFASDDRSLLVVTNLGGAHNDIWRLPLAALSSHGEKLTFGQADEECPSMSADGRWMLWTDNSRGPTGLVLQDIARGSTNWLAISQLDFRQATGRLDLKLLDGTGGKPITGRTAIRHADGKFHAPPGSLYRLWAGDLHVYVEGQAAWALPVGTYELKVTRGPEYPVVRVPCEVRAGETTSLTVPLERWTDQRAHGWYSGENHIHANYGYGHWYNSPRTMLAQCAGEELLVCNFMVANSDGDGVFDREYFRGRPDPLSTPDTVLYWNEEFRSTIWGHMTLVNLKQLVEPLFTGFAHTTNPNDYPTNADIANATHDQDGLVNFTHPAHNVKDPYQSAYSAKELPVDLALGVIDSIDVMGTGHVANVPLWYRFLNCGFHVPASAGTDVFLNRISSRPPGSDRAYVKLDGEFSYERWIAGLKAGHTFVTNGPMIDFTVDGQQPGATLRFAGSTSVKIAARVRAAYPLKKVELIYNGAVATTIDAQDDGREIVVEQSMPIERSGWLTLRASGEPTPVDPRTGAFAHTSAVYLEVADAPLDSRADAEYFLAWIDRLWEQLRKRDRIPPRHFRHVESQIDAARAVYQKLAKNAK
jgi:hypothetical protein